MPEPEPLIPASDASNPLGAAPSPPTGAGGAAGATTPAPDIRRRRLLFRASHRGTFENDLMIGGFVRAGLTGFTDAEMGQLEELLELPDVDLADWLTGRRAIPPGHATPMLLRIKESLIR